MDGVFFWTGLRLLLWLLCYWISAIASCKKVTDGICFVLLWGRPAFRSSSLSFDGCVLTVDCWDCLFLFPASEREASGFLPSSRKRMHACRAIGSDVVARCAMPALNRVRRTYRWRLYVT